MTFFNAHATINTLQGKEVTQVKAIDKLKFSATSLALDGILKYIDKNPQENLLKLVDKAEALTKGIFPKENFEKFRKALCDNENIWTNYALSFLTDIDRDTLKK